MNKFLTISLSAAIFAGISTLGFAQEASTAPTDAQRAELKKVEDQQTKEKRRIETGEKNGKLSPAEREKLRTDEDKIQAKKEEYLKKNGGHLTPEEERNLDISEKKMTSEIHEDRHNTDKVAPEAKHPAESKPAADTATHGEKSRAGEEKKHADDKSHDGDKPQN